MAPRHVFLVLVDLCSIFLFSGIVYGWAPLNDMLLREGFYKELCGAGVAAPCEAQRSALNRAFTLATTAVSLVALPGGSFVDKCGPLTGCLVGGALNMLGLCGFVISKHVGSAQFDVFLVSFITVACGGSITMFCGCIIFTLFKFAYDAGFKFESLFMVYFVMCAINFGLLAIAWAMNRAELRLSKQQAGDGGGAALATSGLQSKPLSQQVCTSAFLTILLFAAIQVVRSNLYLGVVDLIDLEIARKTGAGDGDVGRTTTAVGLIVPQGWVAVPLIELSIHRLGVFGTLHVTNAVGVLYSVAQLIPSLSVQILGAILFAVFRAFLFSIITAYNAELFGPKTLGRIMGICFLAAAILNLAQNPLVQMSLARPGGDFTPLTLGSILVTAPLPFLVLGAQLWQRKQSRMCAEDTARDRFASTPSRARSLSESVPSRTFSHSTAACTAEQLLVSAAIERKLEEERRAEHRMVIESGMATPMGE